MHLILRNWVLCELLISGVAGCFAVVSLSRLAGGRRAVLYLLTAPTAVFLLVGYADLCRGRHKSAYAESRVMPILVLDALVRAVSGLLVPA